MLNKVFFLSHNTVGGADVGETKEEVNRNERKIRRINHVIIFPPSFFPPSRQLDKDSILLSY